MIRGEIRAKVMAFARELLSRGATGPVLRCNAGQL